MVWNRSGNKIRSIIRRNVEQSMFSAQNSRFSVNIVMTLILNKHMISQPDYRNKNICLGLLGLLYCMFRYSHLYLLLKSKSYQLYSFAQQSHRLIAIISSAICKLHDITPGLRANKRKKEKKGGKKHVNVIVSRN